MPESNSDSNNAEPSLDEDSSATGAPPPVSGKADGKPQKSTGLKFATTLSMVLWIVGFVLPFILKKGNPYVWISDTCLLTGFWPLMFYNKAGWTWLVFGILTVALGFGLELIQFLMPQVPQTFWTPEKMAYKPWFMNMHHHITDMHPSMPWILIGGASTIYGVFRIIKTIVKWILKMVRRKT